MNDLRTRTHAFNSNFCVEMQTPKRLTIRVNGVGLGEAQNVFSNPSEIAELNFRGRQFHGYTRLRSIRDEGSQIFLILE